MLAPSLGRGGSAAGAHGASRHVRPGRVRACARSTRPASSGRRSTSSASRSWSSSGSRSTSTAVVQHWDPYPFILLNLAFSTQAAYAAPLILLAQTRQAERDKIASDKAENRHDETERQAAERVAALRTETDKLTALLDANTDLTRQDKELTEQVAKLTREIHGRLLRGE